MNDPTSPYFETDFKNTEMAVIGTFDQLAATIHIDSFCNLYEFGKFQSPQRNDNLSVICTNLVSFSRLKEMTTFL